MRSAGDRRRWVVRALAVIVLAGIVAGAAAVVLSTRGDAAERRSESNPAVPAAAFLAAWHAGDYAAMYALVAPGVRASTTYHRFAHEYRAAGAHREHDGSSPGGEAARDGLARDGPGLDRDDRLRTHRRQPGDPARARPQDLPGRLDAGTDVPRASARRDPHAQGACTGRPRAHPGPRRHRPRRGPARQPHLSRGHGVCARHRVHQGAGGAGDRRPAQARVAGRAEVRPGGPGGVARSDPGRPSPRAAGGGPIGPREPRPDPGPKAGAKAEGRRDDDRPRYPGSVGHGAGSTLWRDRRARPAHGRGAGGRRPRHGRHPAAGIVVQDRDRLGRADRRDGRADRHVPV